MKSVAQILKSKSDNQVVSVAPDVTVYDALRVMGEKNIGAVLVAEGDTICGIFTERDYARKLVLRGLSSRQTKVSELMASPVLYVKPTQSNEECMALMTDNHLRHLPVLDNGRLVGMVSIGDLVKDMISEQRFIIEQLENYIAGSGY